jgi:transposase
VGIDLHRRRSVIVRRTPEGETLETVRIDNDPVALALELAKAGPDPEVVLEACYGWYWAADVLQANGATVHLAHPLGNNWGHRRVKNDERDATDLVDLLRMGRLAEGWIAPPATRELRELVRYRAKLVALRSGLKAQVHAVLAKEGVKVPMSDLFGVAGQALLDTCELARAYTVRVESLRDLIELHDREIAMLEREVGQLLGGDAGYRAIQAIPGVGPVLAAVFVAEIGDVGRFPAADKLCCWAGLTPVTGSPTPPCGADRSPNKVLAWCAGRPSRPSAASGAAPSSSPTTTASPSGATTATSPGWPPLANSLPWCSTACATVRSVAWPRPGEQARTQPGRVLASCHDPHPARSPS